MAGGSSRRSAPTVPVEPTWYKDAILYEVHVRSFADSNGDGIGDFPGLTEKLDYVKELGVTAFWLLPFYPSPLKDDGYDISDYLSVNPQYGTLRDFKTFLREAHRRGLRVVTEIVLNHTSDQHPWFQKARRAPAGSADREFYVWSDTPERYAGARVIFKDFETSNWSWDPLAKAYFWHRFYSHQPDLNYQNPAVVRAMYKVVDFWLAMGVDGLRLDAVPYLYEAEGTSSENLPQTHAFLKALRKHVDERFPGRMLLAEANQWPEDAARYFGEGRGDECHTAFHFPLMPRLFMAVMQENRYPIVDILRQTPPIPTDSQWIVFLRNHDELTLEMVSDEERDYMYRMYAADARMRLNVGIRRRLAPLLRNDRRLIELMVGLLLSVPGTPVLYYGDEIGMGDNIYLGDRNGVRTPMQWSADRNAGFSRSNPQQLYLPVIIDPENHYEAVNVDTQEANPHSLLWFMKRLLALRKEVGVAGRGTLTMVLPDNPKVLAFVRSYAGRRLLVVANLSRLPQSVELDLSAFRGVEPIELFGRTKFPAVDESWYRLTLGGHDLFWFGMDPIAPAVSLPPAAVKLPFEASWTALDSPSAELALAELLGPYLPTRRWYRSKARMASALKWLGTLRISRVEPAPRIALAEVDFAETGRQTYVLPLDLVDVPATASAADPPPDGGIATFAGRGGAPARRLVDAATSPEYARAMLDLTVDGRRFRSPIGEVTGARTSAFPAEILPTLGSLPVTVLKGEQSNTSVRLGNELILKTFRTIGEGRNPELEFGLFFLHQETNAPVPPLVGYVELRERTNGGAETLAVVHRFVANEGDAWTMTLDQLRGFFDRFESTKSPTGLPPGPSLADSLSNGAEPPTSVSDLIGSYVLLARRLGERTAQLHRILAGDSSDPAFAPEPFDRFYARSVYQTMQSRRVEVFDLLRQRRLMLPPPVRTLADEILQAEEAIDSRYRALRDGAFEGQRIRIHGDLHLGQVLFTGKDFVVIDFEGEPARPISDRRIKRSPLKDVAGMVRSFDYAATSAVKARLTPASGASAERLADAARAWTEWISSAYLAAYRKEIAGAVCLTNDPKELETLLRAYLFEKAVYELGYELDNRPDWVDVPLRGLKAMLARTD